MESTNQRVFKRTEELIEAVLRPVTMADENRTSLNPSAFGGVPLPEAIALARRGWREGNDVVKRMRMNIESIIEGSIPVPEIRHDVIGDVIDMGRYVAGEPECMMYLEDTGLTRPAHLAKVVRVVYNIGVSGAVSAQTVLLRGAAVLVLVDTLEKHGVRVELDLGFAVTNRITGGEAVEYYLRLKDSTQHAAIERLGFYLGHVSAIRRLFFALMEHEPDDVRKRFGIGRDNGGSMGFPGVLSEQGDVYVDRILTNTDWSEKFTMLWLRSVLTKQGINLTFLSHDKEEKAERVDNLGQQAIAAFKQGAA